MVAFKCRPGKKIVVEVVDPRREQFGEGGEIVLMMQCWKEARRGGVGSALEVLLLNMQSISALQSTSAAKPTDTTAIDPIFSVMEGYRRL